MHERPFDGVSDWMWLYYKDCVNVNYSLFLQKNVLWYTMTNMSSLGLAILSWCLICTTDCEPSQGSSFRVYDSGRETSLYKGPANYNHEGPNLSLYGG